MEIEETQTLPDGSGESAALVEDKGEATTPTVDVAATEEATATEDGGESTAEPQGDEHKKPPRGVQKRFDELTKEKYEWKRESDYWREMATKSAPEQTPAATPQEDAEPNADNFDDFKDYVKALNKWEVRQEVKRELKASREEAMQEQIQLDQIRQKQTAQQSFRSAAEKIQREKYSDFNDVVGESNAPCTDHMLSTMRESPDGPEVMYFLAKNPAEAERIAGLSPYGQVREIGRLEAKLSGIKPPEPRRITRTTEPARTVSGSGVTERDPNKMSMDDYAKWRMSQTAG